MRQPKILEVVFWEKHMNALFQSRRRWGGWWSMQHIRAEWVAEQKGGEAVWSREDQDADLLRC